MSNSSSDSQKTEQPTPKKLQDARENGQIAESEDLKKVVPLGVVVCVFLIMPVYIIHKLMNNYELTFLQITYNQTSIQQIIGYIMQDLSSSISTVLFVVVFVAVITTAVVIFQKKGIVIKKDAFKLNFERLNPVDNLQQIFSTKNLSKFVMNICKLVIIIILSYLLIKSFLPELLGMHNYKFLSQTALIIMLVEHICTTLIGVCFLFAGIDYAISWRSTMKQLMMTKEEVKEEQKNTIGNPEIIQRRKELHQELIESDDLMDTMDNSSFVLANPTHIAIVVIYSPKKYPLPIVIFKAKGDLAQKIFNLARRCNVPIIRDKWLTRQLFKYSELGKYIPKRFLAYVADIINKNIILMPKIIAEITELNKPAETNMKI